MKQRTFLRWWLYSPSQRHCAPSWGLVTGPVSFSVVVLHALLQHRDRARGGETCIPMQDSQLWLLLSEICPEQLSWVHSHLSPAPLSALFYTQGSAN